MRTADLITACYAQLNVSSVTSLLTDDYGVPAVFQVGRVPRTDSGDPLFFPYVTFAVTSDADFSTDGNLGGDAVVQIDVWDRSGSAVALGEIMRAVSLAVIRQEWSVPGFITCDRESSDVVPDPDGLTMHGIVRVRVLYLD